MIVREIIQRIETLLSKGIPTSLESSHISRRWIYSMMNSYRIKLLSQKVNKKQRISDFSKQTLYCVELVNDSGSDCPCVAEGFCTIKRSRYMIPEIMTGLSDYMVFSVYNANGNVKIDFCGQNEAKYRRYSRHTSKMPYCYIYNDYMYFVNVSHMSMVNITALFENPLDVEEFNRCMSACSDTSNICFNPLEADFVSDNETIDTIIKLTVQEISMAFLSSGEQQERKEETENAD